MVRGEHAGNPRDRSVQASDCKGQLLPHRRPDTYRPTDEDLLSYIRCHPLVTLLELCCLYLWPGLPWHSAEGRDSVADTPRRWPGYQTPISAATWMLRQVRRLKDQRRVLLSSPCCKKARCLKCVPGLTMQVVPALQPPLSIEEPPEDGAPPTSTTVTCAVEGRLPFLVQLHGTIGRVLRTDRKGVLRALGPCHLRGDEYGLELHTSVLTLEEIAAAEHYLETQLRHPQPAPVEALLSQLRGGEALHAAPPRLDLDKMFARPAVTRA